MSADRRPAERYLSDADVATRTAALAFEVEGLIEAGPFGVKAGTAPVALSLARQLEALADETAAQRPRIARTLRTAAHELRRAAEAQGPNDAYRHLCEAHDQLEQL